MNRDRKQLGNIRTGRHYRFGMDAPVVTYEGLEMDALAIAGKQEGTSLGFGHGCSGDRAQFWVSARFSPSPPFPTVPNRTWTLARDARCGVRMVRMVRMVRQKRPKCPGLTRTRAVLLLLLLLLPSPPPLPPLPPLWPLPAMQPLHHYDHCDH